MPIFCNFSEILSAFQGQDFFGGYSAGQSMAAPSRPDLPAHFDLLSPADQSGYLSLRQQLSAPENRHARNYRLETLQCQFCKILEFCIRNDADDAARCLVCGLCPLPPDDIAINIRQLTLLLGKHKSTINGALMKMSYQPLRIKGENLGRLAAVFPHLKKQYADLRSWSVRRAATLKKAEENEYEFNFEFEYRQFEDDDGNGLDIFRIGAVVLATPLTFWTIAIGKPSKILAAVWRVWRKIRALVGSRDAEWQIIHWRKDWAQ
jgi:hypothetical protein